jgi:hypothetical protein
VNVEDQQGGGLLQRIRAALGGRHVSDRLAAVERAVKKLGDAERDRTTSLEARLGGIARTLGEQPTAKDLRELRQALRGGAAQQQPDRQLFEALDQMAKSGRPILIGPWIGEVGFELLYWIPFVQWVRANWQLAPEREVIVSRGGVESWYRRDGADYLDALGFVSPDEFRLSVGEEKRKHRRPVAFDDRLTKAVVQHRSLGEIDILHPGLMYRTFAPYWSDEAGYARIDQFTRYRLLERSANAFPSELPKEYVAVRFYFSESFPDTAQNREFAHGVVSSLAERTPVVVLNPGVNVDEHSDWMPDESDRIITIACGAAPERNLAVQSAVVAGARAFVGTYGGLSHLAPLYQLPAVGFYSTQTFKLHHVYAAQRAFRAIGAGAFTLIDVAQADVVERALGSLVAQ